jgi:hypothetical protein
VYDRNSMILRCLLSDKLASDCECLRALDARRLFHNVVFTQLERAAGASPASKLLEPMRTADVGARLRANSREGRGWHLALT